MRTSKTSPESASLLGTRTDWPIVAVALLLDFPIWTEDQDFFGAGVATWTTDRVEFIYVHREHVGTINGRPPPRLGRNASVSINARNAGYDGLNLGEAKAVFWCEVPNWLASLPKTAFASGLRVMRSGRFDVRR